MQITKSNQTVVTDPSILEDDTAMYCYNHVDSRKHSFANIEFRHDVCGDYWIGDLISDGKKIGRVSTYQHLDDYGHRPSREDQIAALLFDERVIDPAYRTTLIYDGACGFCRRTAKLVRELDKKRLLRIRPRKGTLTLEFLGNDFYVFNALLKNPILGIDAATEICELVFGPGNYLAQLMRMRPVKWLLWRVHYWVMANRGWLIRFWNSDEVIDESV